MYIRALWLVEYDLANDDTNTHAIVYQFNDIKVFFVLYKLYRI